ncbi:MAG: NAD(P)H-dependent oxidoreductase [Alphaproteobacteria bacterium]|nr:NAD(P)H-dependent oxidoreductase [Alphaproteobacteria bacterium]
MSPKLLFLAGSARKNSFNKKLARVAHDMAADKGAKVTFIDLKDYPAPIFCEDLEAEQGMPESMSQLKKLFAGHDGFFIASPEYNSAYSPLLKNTIDWMTRTEKPDEPVLIAFKDKVCALAGASAGGLGGIRGLVPLRMLLGNIGVQLIPNQLALSGAHEAFDDNGALKNDAQADMLENVIDQLISTAHKLHS